MPELPEVETTRNGISQHILGAIVDEVIIRQNKLRWPVTRNLRQVLKQQTLHSIDRRAKYLLLKYDSGTLIIHLGMSGSLRILPTDTAPEKHDHIDIIFNNQKLLRYHDPRRFGAVLWTSQAIDKHKLIAALGPEPLEDEFNTQHLQETCQNKKVAIKNHIMNQATVVGVGNIYASEALYMSGIRPGRAAGKITRTEQSLLVSNIKIVLDRAIQQGGTTLKDFTNSDGKPGYFKQSLHVYGRDGQCCSSCKSIIKKVVIGQRSSFYCPKCQK